MVESFFNASNYFHRIFATFVFETAPFGEGPVAVLDVPNRELLV